MAELHDEPKRSTSVTKGQLEEKNLHHSEVLVNADLMNEAFAAENREHEETILHAIKAHPMACFWAFLMCFTIVSPPVPCH